MVKSIFSACMVVIVLFACISTLTNTEWSFTGWLDSLGQLEEMPDPPTIDWTVYSWSLSTDFPSLLLTPFIDDDTSNTDANFWKNARNFFKKLGSFFAAIGNWLSYFPTFFRSFFGNFTVVGDLLGDLTKFVKYPYDVIVWLFTQVRLITAGGFS